MLAGADLFELARGDPPLGGAVARADANEDALMPELGARERDPQRRVWRGPDRLAAEVVIIYPARFTGPDEQQLRPWALPRLDERELAVERRRGDRRVARGDLQPEGAPLDVAVVIAPAHHDHDGRREEAAGPAREGEARGHQDRDEDARHGQVVGLAVPFVTLLEMVLHQAPPSPMRWKTLLYWVEPRLYE